MKSVYIILAICTITKAQIPNLGFCPDYLPMPDFDMERFLGKWYEAERYFQFSEVATRCVVTDYAMGPSGKIYVSNEVTNRLTGVKRVIDGTLELVGKAGEGKLNVKYSTTPIATETALTVLDTDYENYAVVWSCSGFGPIHAQSAWVMTRERLAPGTVLQQAYGVLDKYKISRTFFVRTDQEGCAIAASDINAANGITGQSTVAEATGSGQKQGGSGKSAGAIEEALPAKNENMEDKPQPEKPAEAMPVAEMIMTSNSNPEPDQKMSANPESDQKMNADPQPDQMGANPQPDQMNANPQPDQMSANPQPDQMNANPEPDQVQKSEEMNAVKKEDQIPESQA